MNDMTRLGVDYTFIIIYDGKRRKERTRKKKKRKNKLESCPLSFCYVNKQMKRNVPFTPNQSFSGASVHQCAALVHSLCVVTVASWIRSERSFLLCSGEGGLRRGLLAAEGDKDEEDEEEDEEEMGGEGGWKLSWNVPEVDLISLDHFANIIE